VPRHCPSARARNSGTGHGAPAPIVPARRSGSPLLQPIFSGSAAGRRARLLGTGQDVWEVIATVRDNNGEIAEAARYLEMPLGLVQAAGSYYGAYPEEIDQWIGLNEQEAAGAHAAYAAGRAAVRRCSCCWMRCCPR
jgi:hypothetical protein